MTKKNQNSFVEKITHTEYKSISLKYVCDNVPALSKS